MLVSMDIFHICIKLKICIEIVIKLFGYKKYFTYLSILEACLHVTVMVEFFSKVIKIVFGIFGKSLLDIHVIFLNHFYS